MKVSDLSNQPGTFLRCPDPEHVERFSSNPRDYFLYTEIPPCEECGAQLEEVTAHTTYRKVRVPTRAAAAAIPAEAVQ